MLGGGCYGLSAAQAGAVEPQGVVNSHRRGLRMAGVMDVLVVCGPWCRVWFVAIGCCSGFDMGNERAVGT